jgi:crotonobetainyl-CoA:carnitine CoA-transferase CaiB-like acyl-CoA transferase
VVELATWVFVPVAMGATLTPSDLDVTAALAGTFHPTGPAMQKGIPQYPPNPLTANYRCADGRHVALCCLQPDSHWPAVCRAIGRPKLVADEHFATMDARAAHRQECVEELEAAFATRTLASGVRHFRESVLRGARSRMSLNSRVIPKWSPTATSR